MCFKISGVRQVQIYFPGWLHSGRYSYSETVLTKNFQKLRTELSQKLLTLNFLQIQRLQICRCEHPFCEFNYSVIQVCREQTFKHLPFFGLFILFYFINLDQSLSWQSYIPICTHTVCAHGHLLYRQCRHKAWKLPLHRLLHVHQVDDKA